MPSDVCVLFFLKTSQKENAIRKICKVGGKLSCDANNLAYFTYLSDNSHNTQDFSRPDAVY